MGGGGFHLFVARAHQLGRCVNFSRFVVEVRPEERGAHRNVKAPPSLKKIACLRTPIVIVFMERGSGCSHGRR